MGRRRDADGEVLLDRKLANTAEDIGRLAAELGALGGERLIGIDLLGGIATLVSAMLLAAGERLVHVPGLAVNRARQGGVGGQAKSDPRDARVIADQLRLRAADFRSVALENDAIAELRLLVSRRDDLVTDQTRRVSRMRYLINTIHPDLERALDLTNAGPLALLARYVTAAEIRAAGPKAIARHLRAKAVRAPEPLAAAAVAAARGPSRPAAPRRGGHRRSRSRAGRRGDRRPPPHRRARPKARRARRRPP